MRLTGYELAVKTLSDSILHGFQESAAAPQLDQEMPDGPLCGPHRGKGPRIAALGRRPNSCQTWVRHEVMQD